MDEFDFARMSNGKYPVHRIIEDVEVIDTWIPDICE